MAPKDADMPSHHALSEDIQEITRHLAGLRRNIENLTDSVTRAGSHQADRVQDAASEAVTALEDAVRRDPVTTLGIALGIGFLLGIVLRR